MRMHVTRSSASAHTCACGLTSRIPPGKPPCTRPLHPNMPPGSAHLPLQQACDGGHSPSPQRSRPEAGPKGGTGGSRARSACAAGATCVLLGGPSVTGVNTRLGITRSREGVTRNALMAGTMAAEPVRCHVLSVALWQADLSCAIRRSHRPV